MQLLLLLLLCLLQVPGALPYSSGAPEFVCSSMIPGHGESTATYSDPFILTVSSDTYSPLQVIIVSIEPMMNVQIRGFMIQARPADSRNTDTRIGSFEAGTDSKVICNNGAATQSYAADRFSATVTWRAPPVPQGDIVFRATVVRRYRDYYTEVYSSVLSFQMPTTTTTTTTPTPPSTPTPEPTTTTMSTTQPTTTVITTTTPPTTTSTTTARNSPAVTEDTAKDSSPASPDATPLSPPPTTLTTITTTRPGATVTTEERTSPTVAQEPISPTTNTGVTSLLPTHVTDARSNVSITSAPATDNSSVPSDSNLSVSDDSANKGENLTCGILLLTWMFMLSPLMNMLWLT